MRLIHRFALFVGFLALLSCIDNSDYKIDRVELNPSETLPLIHGDLSIYDILDSTKSSGNIKVYSDGLVYLAYEQQLESQNIRNLFTIPDKNLNRSFVLPPGILPAFNSDVRTDSLSQVIDFDLSPEQLYEIALKSGGINFSTSVIPSSSQLEYEIAVYFPDFISNTTQKPLEAMVKGTGTLPLADYTLHLDKNKFNMKLVLILKKHTSPILIDPGTSISIALNFGSLEFNYIKGFFGDQSVSLDMQKIDIPAFKNAFQGADVSLAQTFMGLTIVNDNGVPCVIDFKTLEARKDDGTSIPVTLDPPNPVSILYPSVLGTSATSLISITNTKQVLDFAPSAFYYQADARINKNLTSGDNFLADTSKLRMKLNIEIPLYGNASNIILRDTINLDLSKTDESQISSAALKLTLTNELPLQGDVQFYLADENYEIIGELIPEDQTTIVKGSTVDASGNLQSPGVYDNLIQLNDDDISLVFKAKHIIVLALLSTSKDSNGNFPDVKFKTGYTLNVTAGIQAKLKLSVDL
jgi:hypothetical protein